MSKNPHHHQQPKEPGAQAQRRLKRFGGQHVPVSSSGMGRVILYRCPLCGQPWLQDGSQSHLRLSPERLESLTEHLGADLEHLPAIVCRLCLWQTGTSYFSVDTYSTTAGKAVGYGFLWEHPVGLHLQAAIRGVSTLLEPVGPADVPHEQETLRAALYWLAELPATREIRLWSPEENRSLAQNNPAGSGRQWKALSFVALCPLLSDLAVVVLATALPQEEPLDPHTLIALWQLLAEMAAAPLGDKETEH